MISHNTQSGFTPTPILVPFRFFKNGLPNIIRLVQELISCGNSDETKKPHQNWCRGFTLVEVLVSLGIFTVLTAVVLANYRAYDTNAIFANASEDVVLALRQAQVYGVGVKGLPAGSCGGLTQFDCSYGVYFESFTNKIIIYADRNADRTYTSADNPPVETISWGNSVRIQSAVVSFGAIITTFFADITFNRPNPDAFINDNTPNRANSGDTAAITLEDTVTGKTSVVTITKAGQILLQ